MNTILITGGAGFIGSAVVRHLLKHTAHVVVNVDKLTYAGNSASLKEVADSPRYSFEQADICDRAAMEAIFSKYVPDAVMHLAAESHVDRSIDGPAEFVNTNIVGTSTLLEVSRAHAARQVSFRFHHISTDEVFGDLEEGGSFFREDTPYAPSSPYAASKASSDHLVRAWHRTYGLDVVISNCSNNYGPRQFPEKLIPLMILNALEGKPLPLYGKGNQVRDWLYVEDHAKALYTVLAQGKPGETYNIGGNNQKRNLDVVQELCEILDKLLPLVSPDQKTEKYYKDLITYVSDRPGHDCRYAIDAGKIVRELGWQPEETFASGLEKTVRWYLDNRWWWEPLKERYGRQRIGTAK